MGSFQGKALGAFMTILGWDGSAFQNILVDADGHLQVDALTAQLITGFATETTLGTVKDRIGALVTPASGSTNKLLTDMLTALQLIDDLRGALDSVNTDELVVNVDASVLPTDAATETSLQGIEDQIPDQLIGFSAVYRESVSELDAAAGQNTLSGTAVAANTLHIVTSIAAWDSNSAITDARINIVGDGSARSVMRVGALGANVSINYQGQLILDAGDYIQAIFGGVTLNDNIFIVAHGWKASV